MKMYFTELGEYEMNNHAVEYEPDRRIGWEPKRRGHPNAAPEASRQASWGRRWSFELTPDGPDALVVRGPSWTMPQVHHAPVNTIALSCRTTYHGHMTTWQTPKRAGYMNPISRPGAALKPGAALIGGVVAV